MKKSRLKIGEILVNEKLLTPEDLEKALQEQKKKGGHLGILLIKMGLVKETDLVRALGKQMELPYAKGPELLIPALDQGLEKLMGVEFCRRNAVMPLNRKGNKLNVAMADPLDLTTIETIQHMTHCEVEIIVATRTDIIQQLNLLYGEHTLLKEAIADTGERVEKPIELEEEEKDISVDELVAKAEDAPIIRLVDLFIRQAIEDRASDIHIEAMKERVNVRYRIDGVLYEIAPPPRHLLPPVVSRIKILSRMDIAERRLPQDGAFAVKYQDRVIDLRVSTIPTVFGEKVVLRLLDKGKINLDLNELGFDPKQLEIFKTGLLRPHGLVIITGPTGSGKTTTLYSGLSLLNSPKKNIVTIEDPVEYKLAGINQVQVKTEIGLTFASGLRAFLRQDPDIIMVGEIRDLETAQICIRAALTGHMVLSTIHTNDAVGVIPRLIDIGIEPYLVTASLNVVLAQRLVRRLCEECKEPYEPEKEVAEKYKIRMDILHKAKGCERCNFLGYRGRVAIYEVFLISETVKLLILKRVSVYEIKEEIKKQGVLGLREAGMKKAEAGLTTVEEVLQVTVDVEE